MDLADARAVVQAVRLTPAPVMASLDFNAAAWLFTDLMDVMECSYRLKGNSRFPE